MRAGLILIIVAGWMAQPAVSQTELTAEQIVERHLEALGGSEAIGAITSLEKSGTYAYNGIEHPFVSYHKTGKKAREEITGLQLWATSFKEGHTVTRGTNGTAAWVKDETRPPEWREIPPIRAKLVLEDADIHGALHNYREKGHSLALLERGDVEGTPTYRLELTLASGVVQIWHLDVESFLVLQIEVVSDELQDDYESPRAWLFDDYRPVGGVQMPFWIYVEERLFSREYIIETIEANVSLEDALFEPPEGAVTSPAK